MGQIFSRTADTWFRAMLVAGAVGTVGALVLAESLARSDHVLRTNRTPPQPVPFSHRHHVGGLGIDCRYCHNSVEVSADAGFPPTHTCMTCHSEIWTQAPLLAPVRQSLAENKPLDWQRVARVPDYAYFRHDIHVQKGVGCVECHGRVDEMSLTYRPIAFRMQWCLDCHRDPAPNLRPRDQVFAMDWKPPEDRRALGEQLVKDYGIHVGSLTHCYVCHR